MATAPSCSRGSKNTLKKKDANNCISIQEFKEKMHTASMSVKE